MLNFLKLCLLTHINETPLEQYKHFLLQAIEGGVTSVQLREKNRPKDELFFIAEELKTLLDPLGIPLIINDNVELAKAVDASGVHVGQSDMSPTEAREMLGAEKIIGWSVETWDDLICANELTCINYVAASAVFHSRSKACKTYWGLAGLEKVVAFSHHPVIGIGGIESHNVASVMETNVCGVAVISAIHESNDPKRASAELIKHINYYLERKTSHV